MELGLRGNHEYFCGKSWERLMEEVAWAES